MARFKMMQRTNLSSALLTFLLATGCADNGDGDNADTGGSANDDLPAAGAPSGGGSSNTNTLSGSVEVLTFWGNQDLSAIENAASAFTKKYPDVSVDVTSIDSGWSGMDEAIDNRLAKALPMPAAFQKTSPDSVQRWDAAGEIADLKDLYVEPESEEEGGNAWQDVIPESILVTNVQDGKYISVGTNLNRTNSIFYNKKLFEQNGLSPPKTIEEFKQLVITLKDDVDLNGGAPLVIGNVYNWTLQVFVLTCLGPHLMGPDEFTNYFAGRGPAENAKFEELLELALFLRCGSDPTTECDGYFNTDMDTIDHVPSIDAFIAGYEDDAPKFAMAPAGDWVKAWMKDGGLEPGVDFDSFACPVANEGDTPVFTGGVDAFMMASRSPDPEAALAFMKFLGSKDGQLAINEKKGAIPVRNDINLADYPSVFDAVQVRTYADFQSSRYLVESWKAGALPSMGQELKDSLSAGTIEAAYNYVKNNYSTLK
jgi:glucose/mannose transport system substrate-binding protein